MAKATKLPSGAWSVNAYLGKDEQGKQIRKRFTGKTKREAELAAAQYITKKHRNDQPENKTVKQAIEDYLEDNAISLSPSTARGYRTIRNNLPITLLNASLESVSISLLQRSINEYGKTRSPKTVRNAVNLLSPVFKYAKFDSDLKDILLPGREKPEIKIPTDEQVKSLLESVRGTDYEMPCMMAAYLGMRRGEIAALRWEDVDIANKKLHVRRSVAWDDQQKEWVEKSPKTYDSKRVLSIPEPVIEMLGRQERKGETICKVTAGTISAHFFKLLENAGVEHFRFHDLRHYYASVMLALGIPNKYAERRMGHKSDRMLKTVYQHLMESKIDETDRMIDEYFSA